MVQKEAAGENDLLHHLYLPEILVHFPLLYSVASAGLELYKRSRQFSKLHKKLAEVGETVLQRHTWYITEELIPLSLFNTMLPTETLNKLAEKISQLPEDYTPNQNPALPKVLPTSSRSLEFHIPS